MLVLYESFEHHRRTVALQRAFESRRPPILDCSSTRTPWTPDRRVAALAAVSALPLVGPNRDPALRPGGRSGSAPSAVARTQFIDDVITAELDGDPTLRQLVILGAGFDSRAHQLTGIRSCCRRVRGGSPCDAGDQTTRIEASDRPVHPVTYVRVDFEADDLAAALDASGFDRTTPAVVWGGR